MRKMKRIRMIRNFGEKRMMIFSQLQVQSLSFMGKKSDWEKSLPTLIIAYNATHHHYETLMELFLVVNCISPTFHFYQSSNLTILPPPSQLYWRGIGFHYWFNAKLWCCMDTPSVSIFFTFTKIQIWQCSPPQLYWRFGFHYWFNAKLLCCMETPSVSILY